MLPNCALQKFREQGRDVLLENKSLTEEYQAAVSGIQKSCVDRR
jgi:hypothetical protein